MIVCELLLINNTTIKVIATISLLLADSIWMRTRRYKQRKGVCQRSFSLTHLQREEPKSKMKGCLSLCFLSFYLSFVVVVVLSLSLSRERKKTQTQKKMNIQGVIIE
jgi:hypothetical protein